MGPMLYFWRQHSWLLILEHILKGPKLVLTSNPLFNEVRILFTPTFSCMDFHGHVHCFHIWIQIYFCFQLSQKWWYLDGFLSTLYISYLLSPLSLMSIYFCCFALAIEMEEMDKIHFCFTYVLFAWKCMLLLWNTAGSYQK